MKRILGDKFAKAGHLLSLNSDAENGELWVLASNCELCGRSFSRRDAMLRLRKNCDSLSRLKSSVWFHCFGSDPPSSPSSKDSHTACAPFQATPMVAQGEGQHPSHAIHPILDPRFQPYTRFLVRVHHMAHGRSRFPSLTYPSYGLH